MLRDTAHRPARASSIQDRTATGADPKRGVISPRSTEAATAARSQEEAEEVKALLVTARPELARAVVRQFAVAPDQPVRPNIFGLTSAQKILLDFIRVYRAAHGVTPSFEEMRQGIGLASKSGVHRLVASLEVRGHVLRVPRRARSIVLCEVAP